VLFRPPSPLNLALLLTVIRSNPRFKEGRSGSFIWSRISSVVCEASNRARARLIKLDLAEQVIWASVLLVS